MAYKKMSVYKPKTVCENIRIASSMFLKHTFIDIIKLGNTN